MHRPIPSRAALVPLLAVLAAACGGASVEQQVLRRYFDALRLRDQATLGFVATVRLDPETEGIVQRFRIVSVGDERRQALRIRELARALREAREADEAFIARMRAFQKEHADEIDRVLKAEARKAALRGRDAALQAEWRRWRDQMAEHAKRVADARRKLAAETRVAELSVYDAQNPVEVEDYDGELVTKDVTIEAEVLTPDRQTVTRTYVVTLQRAELKGPKGERRGRWVITGIRPAS
ncbi:MAG TPA: hypothetical protein VNK92_06845 [Vicinamibacterales bacterium]|jgi:hypothetical protein|nr:hypothetical protein [Vicinamibacterales bacterium]